MSRKSTMIVLAGAALGLGNIAVAQTADLDIDRAYAAELMADAQGRTSLLQAGGSGHDGAFHMGDASGNFRLNVGALMQFRYMINSRDEKDGASLGDDDVTLGFDSPRNQLRFWGNIVNPQWTYAITVDFGSAEAGPYSAFANGFGQLLDAWGQYNMDGEGEGTWVRWGQFQNPAIFEETTAPEFQLAAERSVTNEFFSPGRTQGVIIGHDTEDFRVQFGFSDGADFAGNGETSASFFNSGAEADFAFTFRGDYKFSGDWSAFDDFTSWKGSDNAMRLGGSIHYQESGDTNPSTQGNAVFGAVTDTTYLLWSVDFSYESDGWNAFIAYMGNSIDVDFVGGGSSDTTNQGIVAQGGVFLSDNTEFFARWDTLILDDDALASGVEDTLNFLTFGINYYFVPESHAAKFTADIVYSFEETDAIDGSGAFGNLPDADTTGLLGASDGEFVLRLQMQLLF